MFKPGGYGYSFDVLGIKHEHDTFTCFHCNNVVKVKPGCNPDDIGGMCKGCMKMICPGCLDQGCTPFEKRLEAVEARDRALRSYGV